MAPVTKLRLTYVALAIVWIVAVTVLWRLVPNLSEWVGADSVVVGGLVGILAGGVGTAYQAGRRDAS